MDSAWRKSTRSGSSGDCVEARYVDHAAQVRDSKDQAGPVLSFNASTWTGFVHGIKIGQFNR
ncbi:DUF397 domain-containing protein [Solwaraspora sp. WMMD406]|uniref:DUF397 domain-containing protein n=1 Tax=Solwaraspora sp. WMMD406 TaxID=3016095 RepID=UPI002415EC84|nr:DUF397 domain-containing protein [Solwaraspora sp. WMMD406]MDG4762737.1 DUF397 domain-containing protein [Solwaraspora sp. WMMD406]